MLKANKKTLILTSAITLLPMMIGLFLWKQLPDTMATHFGFSNEADGFSSKPFTVIGIPLFLLVMEWICAIVTSNDPRKQNISPKIFTLVLWIVPVVSVIVAAIIYPYNLGYKFDMTFIAELFMGLLFIIVGNYLPKSRQNYTVGIRVPWTLADEENWNRTHRMAGFLWVLCGILLLVCALCRIWNPILIFGLLLVTTIIPIVYSYLLYKKSGPLH